MIFFFFFSGREFCSKYGVISGNLGLDELIFGRGVIFLGGRGKRIFFFVLSVLMGGNKGSTSLIVSNVILFLKGGTNSRGETFGDLFLTF